MPFRIDNYDNPETIRLKKYAAGPHFVLRAARTETGCTPKEVVWQKNKARLYRYDAGKEKRYSVPVLLVYALILRPYILDLVPGNSFVEYLTDEGFDVYLLDWGTPGYEERNLSFENYVLDLLLAAVERVLESSRAERLTLFGYCQGGTMSAMYATFFPERLKNLILLAAPVDFAPEDPGPFGLWTLWSRNSEGWFDPDLATMPFGNVPADVVGRFIEGSARVYQPALGYPDPRERSWERAADAAAVESFLAASKWVDDGVPFPGAAFRQWIRDFYQKNRLVKGELELRGRRVDLSSVRCSLLNIAGEKDYVCPVSQARPTAEIVGSEDKELLLLDAGHVGLMAGSAARCELWPRVRDWLRSRSR